MLIIHQSNLPRLTESLSSDYGDLFLSADFADFVIQIGSEEMPTHKAILSARVPYFKRLFASGMKEAVENRIQIQDGEVECFKAVLRFIYSGQARHQGSRRGSWYQGTVAH